MDLFPQFVSESAQPTSTRISSNVYWFLTLGFIIAFAAFLYWYFRPKAKEVSAMGPYQLKGTSSNTENVFNQAQVRSALGNNFTLSFFLYMNDINQTKFVAAPSGEIRFEPLLAILGVGKIYADPVHQIARISLNPLTKTQTTAADGTTRVNTINAAETVLFDIPNFMVSRWNQLTLTIEGRSVDIYLNGNLVKSAQLLNLPILYPVGVLLEKSPGFTGQAALFQGWPRRLTESDVLKNYKRNTDLRGKPLVPDTRPILSNVFSKIKSNFCDIGLCGFRIEVGPLQYVDYDFA